MKQGSLAQSSDEATPRWSRVTRALAYLPALAATTFSFCGLPAACPADQSLAAGATYADGVVVPPAIAAQCSAPGPHGSPCNGPVNCYSNTEYCCGQWWCAPANSFSVPDAGGDAAYRWNHTVCAGPLDPPEITA